MHLRGGNAERGGLKYYQSLSMHSVSFVFIVTPTPLVCVWCPFRTWAQRETGPVVAALWQIFYMSLFFFSTNPVFKHFIRTVPYVSDMNLTEMWADNQQFIKTLIDWLLILSWHLAPSKALRVKRNWWAVCFEKWGQNFSWCKSAGLLN